MTEYIGLFCWGYCIWCQQSHSSPLPPPSWWCFYFGALEAEVEPARPHWLVFMWVGGGGGLAHSMHLYTCVCVWASAGRWWPAVTSPDRRLRDRNEAAVPSCRLSRSSCVFSVWVCVEGLSVKMGLQQYSLCHLCSNKTLLGLFTSSANTSSRDFAGSLKHTHQEIHFRSFWLPANHLNDFHSYVTVWHSQIYKCVQMRLRGSLCDCRICPRARNLPDVQLINSCNCNLWHFSV